MINGIDKIVILRNIENHMLLLDRIKFIFHNIIN
jgi:hypothetical protein